MKSNIDNQFLYSDLRCNDTYRAKDMLNTSKDINVLYQEGAFFRFVIKNNNVETCSALLTYFETKQFSKKNTEYQEAKEKLIEILENAICEREIPKEMKQVLSPYLDFEGDLYSRLQEFNEEENSDYQLWSGSLQSNSDNPENIICSGEIEPSPDLNYSN